MATSTFSTSTISTLPISPLPVTSPLPDQTASGVSWPWINWFETLRRQVNSISVAVGNAAVYTAGAGISISPSYVISNTSPNVQSDWNATSGLAVILNQPPITYSTGTGTTNITGNLAVTGTITGASGSVLPQVNSDWNATSGVAQILNKPPITYDGTTTSFGSNVTINSGGTGYGLRINGTTTPLGIYSPDGSRNFQIGISNTTDPALYSSTGVVDFANPVLINGASGTLPALAIKGNSLPLELYSPDGTRNFQIGVGNTSDPNLYSSTGTLGCAANLIINSSGSPGYGLRINGSTSPFIIYSPDSSRNFQIGITNTTNPNLYSSTGTLGCSANVVINSPGTGYALQINGNSSPLIIYSPDGSRNFQIGVGNTSNPNLYSSTGTLGFANAVALSDTLYLPGPRTTSQVLFGTSPYAAGVLCYSGAGNLHLSAGIAYNGTSWIASQTSGSYVRVIGIGFDVSSGSGLTVGSAAATTLVFSAYMPMANFSIVALYAGTQTQQSNYLASNSGTVNLSAGCYLNTASQWVASQGTASILGMGPSYGGGFGFYANTGLTIGAVYGPAVILQVDGTGNITKCGSIASGNHTITSSSGYALTIQGNASPVLIYSPDTSRNLQIGMGNTSDPNIYSSTGQIGMVGSVSATVGYRCRAGNGGAVSNAFNIYWTGAAQLWIDTTNVGTISLTSDYRVKENVESLQHVLSESALSLVSQLRPVSFRYKDIPEDIYRSDERTHYGFIAHELEKILPGAVNGEKDALTSDGNIQPQSLNALDIIALLTRAVQELAEKVEHYAPTYN
jgi:hypothetical protein